MRLLNVSSLELKSFNGSELPDYTILSHTWGEDEVTFQDIATVLPKVTLGDESANLLRKAGLSKVVGACELAARHGYQWIWIDTCCIDKSSSAELQEAINSMWNWYKNATVCYAYLADVPNQVTGGSTDFRKSRWFTRGWTLQELIAPWSVEFYAANWSSIGTKLRWLDEIHDITGISKTALKTSNPETEMVAEIMSWAAHRSTTREEDLAYCLMGLFGINMPMLYGEGGTRAFLRLQEEIFRRKPDHSMFLFTYCNSNLCLLAERPNQFCRKVRCRICKTPDVELFPKVISYSELRHTSLRSIQHAIGTSYDELFIRHEGQEATLTIIDGEEAEGKLFPCPVSRIKETLGKPILEPFYFTVLLHCTDRFGRRFGLKLSQSQSKLHRFRRVSAPVVLYSGTDDLPPPQRVRFLPTEQRAYSSFPHSIELKSSEFKFVDSAAQNSPGQENDNQTALRYVASSWQRQLQLSHLEDKKLSILITLRSSDWGPQNCSITAVAVSHETPSFKLYTPPSYSSDELDIALPGQGHFLISVRRLPTHRTQEQTALEPKYKHRLQIERIVPIQ